MESLRHTDRQLPTVPDAIDRALDYLQTTQADHGAWEGDYGGPLFLLPLYVATLYIIGQDRELPERVRIDDELRAEMVRYMRGQQNDDGGWGLHVEGRSHVYTTVANYVALRLLGESREDADLVRGRRWIADHGGPTAAAPWGKFLLALLDLLPYAGMLRVPPELWLLPRALPVHPGRMWCHARMVYLPMSYLYGIRARAKGDPLLDQIRHELYEEKWEAFDWPATATRVAPEDEYVALSRPFRAVNKVLGGWEALCPDGLRRRALDYVLEQIRREDANTNFICIGPINKLLNTLCWYFAAPDGPELRRHLDQLPDYLWGGDDGVKMQGYNSSQLWDTAFAVQAVCATGRASAYGDMLGEAHAYIEANQVLDDVADGEACYRDRSCGGWPFSDRDHGWPISDCTAEGLEASLALEGLVDEPLESWRMREAAEQILAMQNDDGGWPTYEKARAPGWLEALNPAACFGDIMVDYSYVECTSACVQALAHFRRRDPAHAPERIEEAIGGGADFLLDEQRDDGSWYGSWGICFTYGTWFGVSGLRAAGYGPRHRAIERACDFLIDRQLPDGGWGELAESCRQMRYVSSDAGQAVMTSWALLALAGGARRDTLAFRRGVRFLLERQRPDGSWPDEHIAGVFNRTCAIHYDNYLKIFPLWALAGGH